MYMEYQYTSASGQNATQLTFILDHIYSTIDNSCRFSTQAVIIAVLSYITGFVSGTGLDASSRTSYKCYRTSDRSQIVPWFSRTALWLSAVMLTS